MGFIALQETFLGDYVETLRKLSVKYADSRDASGIKVFQRLLGLITPEKGKISKANMKLRSALLVLVCSLIVGSSGPVFAADATSTRSDQVTSIQNQYNPLFDAQCARLMIVKKKIGNDASTLRTFKPLLADFLDMRRILDSNLTSSTSDLDAVKSFAEEELGFNSKVPNGL